MRLDCVVASVIDFAAASLINVPCSVASVIDCAAASSSCDGM